VTASKPLQNNKQITSSSLNSHKITKNNQQFQKKLCLKNEAFDIWWHWVKSRSWTEFKQSNDIVGSTLLFNLRLRVRIETCSCWWWKRLFFQSSFHQLYGDPNHHLLIRQAGVQYLSNNPEGCIESNTENSCNEYINNMSMQGTWCDALFVQAVVDCQNVGIYIIESHGKSC